MNCWFVRKMKKYEMVNEQQSVYGHNLNNWTFVSVNNFHSSLYIFFFSCWKKKQFTVLKRAHKSNSIKRFRALIVRKCTIQKSWYAIVYSIFYLTFNRDLACECHERLIYWILMTSLVYLPGSDWFLIATFMLCSIPICFIRFFNHTMLNRTIFVFVALSARNITE